MTPEPHVHADARSPAPGAGLAASSCSTSRPRRCTAPRHAAAEQQRHIQAHQCRIERVLVDQHAPRRRAWPPRSPPPPRPARRRSPAPSACSSGGASLPSMALGRSVAASDRSSAWARSAIRSSRCSSPTESRKVASVTPASASRSRAIGVVGGAGRMADQGLRAAQADRQPSSFRASSIRNASASPPLQPEGKGRAGAAALPLHQRVLARSGLGQADEGDAGDLGMALQIAGDGQGVLAGALAVRRGRVSSERSSSQAVCGSMVRAEEGAQGPQRPDQLGADR